MERRTFLSLMGLGWLATSFPMVVAAFLDKQQPTTAAPSDFKPVGTVSQLESNGQISLKQFFGPEPILVVREPKTAKVIAVNPTCTHRGCLINWKAQEEVFDCPCHHSQFSVNGQVLRGPADDPLQTYTVEVQGQQVLVKQPTL